MDKTTKSIVTIVAVIVILGLLISGYNTPMTKKVGVDRELGIQAVELVRQADVVDKAQAGYGAVVGLDNAQIMGFVAEAKALREKVGVYCDTAAGTCQLPSDPTKLKEVNTAMQNYTQASNNFIAYVQQHPQLRAADAFDTFMISVEGSANRVAVQGRVVQTSIADLKLYCLNFPGSIFCGLRGVTGNEYEFYRAPENKSEMPKNAIPTVVMPQQ